jgi:hypothetical protein
MASGYSALRRWLRANRVREAGEQRRADIPVRRAFNGCVCPTDPCFKFPCVSSASPDGQPMVDGKYFFETDEPRYSYSNVPGPLTADHLKASIEYLRAVARGEVKVSMPAPDPVPPWLRRG